MGEALPPGRLRNSCDPSVLRFSTTAELPEVEGALGQERAEEAIRFAVGLRQRGFNLFAMGSPGLGKHETVRRILKARAKDEETPPDWCYVHDFASGQKPKALKLPPGRAPGLVRAMDHFVLELRSAIPAAFETDEYRARRREIEAEFSERQDKAFDEVRVRAREKGLDLVRMPVGMALAPFQDGEVMDPETYRKMPVADQDRIAAAMSGMQKELEKVIQEIPRWRREAGEKVRELNRTVTRTAVHDLVLEARQGFEDLPDVQAYLSAVEEDVLSHAEVFRPSKEGEAASAPPPAGPDGTEEKLRRYRVNVLVSHAAGTGAPVVRLDHAIFPNLVGRVEHLSQLGTLVTDFTLIRPGALHEANGGYLLIDAHDVLSQPLAFSALKRALASGSIRIELPAQSVGLVTAGFLEPEPVPLDVKVVLLGDRSLYYLLSNWDPEFADLFKVAADFDEDVPRDAAGVEAYGRLIGSVARREELLPFDRDAVARLVEHGSRTAEDGERLSLRIRDLVDLLHESDLFARGGGRPAVSAADVERALEGRERRADRMRTRILHEMERGTLLVDTEGARTGLVNALTVVRLGETSFGHPTRVTARVRQGSGKVVDILREVEMGGPNHTKGVLILGGFLAGRYLPDRPLSLAASLVLEQSYAGVEGDSASVAELCALLSALAGAPVLQSLAVTGSVNQHGEVQAIGGVNEKIEGFFALCARRGLSGTQGVLIPKSNIPHLMLRKEVVAAAEEGRFFVYPVATVDEAVERLTGLPAGERGADGRFPKGSVNERVEARLLAFAKAARAAGKADRGKEET